MGRRPNFGTRRRVSLQLGGQRPPPLSPHANKARAAASKNRTVTAVLYNKGNAVPEEPCIPLAVPVSSALPGTRPMTRISATAKALSAGLVVTLLQMLVAIF